MDWLDLTETAGKSIDEVNALLAPGAALAGWSYATRDQLRTAWNAFGGDDNFYSGLVPDPLDPSQPPVWPTQNQGLFSKIAPLMGDLFCAGSSSPYASECDTTHTGFSVWITADIADEDLILNPLNPSGRIMLGERLTATVSNFWRRDGWLNGDYVNLQYETITDDFGNAEYGSALYRMSAVPVPAAVWLFGSGLLGLVGLARRKKA